MQGILRQQKGKEFVVSRSALQDTFNKIFKEEEIKTFCGKFSSKKVKGEGQSGHTFNSSTQKIANSQGHYKCCHNTCRSRAKTTAENWKPES